MAGRVKTNKFRGSHLPILLRVLRITTGPVLELGAGLFSTPILHALCQIDNRKLVTYENSPEFFGWVEQYRTPFHDVYKVDDWDQVDLSTVNWSVALVDHSPNEHRGKELARLTHAEYVVAHDTNRSWENKYNYRIAYPLYKYQRKYQDEHPNTSVLSNIHPLDALW